LLKLTDKMNEDSIRIPISSNGDKYSYSRKTKRGVKSCFQTINENGVNESTILSYPEVIAETNLGPNLNELLEKVMIYRRNNNTEGLQKEREKLSSEELVNLIIYDVQTTGVPEVIENYDENGQPLESSSSNLMNNSFPYNTEINEKRAKSQHISYPAIIQFSFYHPKTGRHLARYVKPHKPISYEAAKLTGIYNSFSTEFELPMYPEKCDPKSLEDVVMIKYVNQSLLDREEVRENATLFREQDGEHGEDDIGEMAIQKFLEDIGNDVNDVISLEDEGALMLHELEDDIFEFISRGEGDNTKTIMLAHNGSRWAEPIFRAEMERICASENIKNYIFLDSKDLYSSIIGQLIENEQQIIDNNLSRRGNIKSNVNINDKSVKLAAMKLGESREESFNTMIDVLNLYSNIEYISETIYGRSDWNFIVSKILEEIYNKQQTE